MSRMGVDLCSMNCLLSLNSLHCCIHFFLAISYIGTAQGHRTVPSQKAHVLNAYPFPFLYVFRSPSLLLSPLHALDNQELLNLFHLHVSHGELELTVTLGPFSLLKYIAQLEE